MGLMLKIACLLCTMLGQQTFHCLQVLLHCHHCMQCASEIHRVLFNFHRIGDPY